MSYLFPACRRWVNSFTLLPKPDFVFYELQECDLCDAFWQVAHAPEFATGWLLDNHFDFTIDITVTVYDTQNLHFVNTSKAILTFAARIGDKEKAALFKLFCR